MTTSKEIGELLHREFPGRFVSFTIDAFDHNKTDMTIYTSKTGHIKCVSVADGIAKLRDALPGGTGPDDPFAADVGIPVGDDATGDKP